MKEKIYRFLIFTFSIVLLFIYLNNCIIGSDIHIIECESENCSKCEVIYNAKELLKSIFLISEIIILYNYKENINKLITSIVKRIICSLILLKVQLNE